MAVDSVYCLLGWGIVGRWVEAVLPWCGTSQVDAILTLCLWSMYSGKRLFTFVRVRSSLGRVAPSVSWPYPISTWLLKLVPVPSLAATLSAAWVEHPCVLATFTAVSRALLAFLLVQNRHWLDFCVCSRVILGENVNKLKTSLVISRFRFGKAHLCSA